MSSAPKKPRRRRATSYDVARLAGVSQSAVSRVYKDGASASEEMRKRVLNAAAEVGYRPNAIARGLITQRSNMVGVIIARQTNLYYPDVLVQLTEAFSEHAIRVLLFTVERESDAAAVVDQLLQYQVDAVVTAALLPPAEVQGLKQEGIPVVFFNRSPKDGKSCAVRCDHEEGERWLATELVAAGHQSFALITGPEDSAVSLERMRGARTMLGELGIDQIRTVGGDYSYQSGASALDALLGDGQQPPDAIIAANDVMAIGCIDRARGHYGFAVPEDLSVVGFDGVGPASYAPYRLTTVRQPIRRMTKATVAMIQERLSSETPLSPEERVFAGDRVTGHSARFATQARGEG